MRNVWRLRIGATRDSMIHLDTNYLIGLAVQGAAAALDVDGWLAEGETLAASAIAWAEFLNGPVTPLEISRAESDFQVFVPHGLVLAVAPPAVQGRE